jgi:hypothetical protein
MPIPNTSPNLFGWWQQLDKKLGGVLPRGGTPVSTKILNQLPESINLGYRHVTGIGNKDLQFSEQFKRNAIQQALKKGPLAPGQKRAVRPYQQEYRTPVLDTIPTALGIPVLGDFDPSAAPLRYSLGRYNVFDEGDKYTVRDTYDLVNEYESPYLQKMVPNPKTGELEYTPGRRIGEGVVSAIAGVLDPSEFLRSYIHFRKFPPKPYEIEFSVPKEYGIDVGP